MTYSFLNISAFMVGPGIAANLAAGAAAAEEGIAIEPVEDKNKMDIGADGQGQHSLIASDAKTITVTLLKTSPVNAILQAAYDLQSTSSALWGKNVFTCTDSARGDTTIGTGVAFKKDSPKNYKKEAGTMEWVFDCIKANTVLGVG
jgi:hypothetical protein